jgi:hypothetical protein
MSPIFIFLCSNPKNREKSPMPGQKKVENWPLEGRMTKIIFLSDSVTTFTSGTKTWKENFETTNLDPKVSYGKPFHGFPLKQQKQKQKRALEECNKILQML